MPDIFTFDSPNCAAYANSKYLTDLTSYLTDEEKAKIINPNEYDGKMYGIPIQESSAGFFYNKALLDQAGVDVSGITVDNPWTFSEFKEVCKKLKAKNITPVDMRMDATNDETAPYLLYPFIYAAGGSFLDSTGKVATGYFNSDASKKGYQFLRDLLDAKYTSYGIGATDFYTGKVGLYLSSGWSISFMDSKYKSTFPDRSTWGILPYPKEVIAASPNGSWSFGVGTNTAEDKRPVIELLKYITNATSSKTITDATGMIPANRDVATNYEANSPEDVLQQQLVKTSKVRTPTVGYPEFSSTFNQVISALSEGSVSDLVDNKAQVLQRKLDQIKYAD